MKPIDTAATAVAPTPDAPTATAQAITGRDYLSWSQVSTMRSCPRKFAFHYVERAEPEFTASSLAFGSAIHSALQLYFQMLLEGATASHAELLLAFRQAWAESLTDAPPIRFNKGDDAGVLDDLAGRMLRAFLDSDLARPAGPVIAVEEELRARLAPDLPELLARVDVVWQGPDALHVTDFKTSRSRWNEQKAAESAEQLLLYRYATQGLSRGVGLPVHLHFGVLTKAKAPAVQQLDVPLDVQRMTGLVTTVRQVWSAVEAGNFYANPSPMSCSTCPFRGRCPAFAGQ